MAARSVRVIDDRRWSTRLYYHPDRSEPGKSYTWSAGLSTGVDLFEPSFFGISPREAAQMDPQQRLLLDLAEGRSPPEPVVEKLRLELIERRTTASPPD